jgi:hypothetical protein
VQHDYIEQRDACRSYAEAKVDLSLKELGKTGDAKAHNAQLVALFSECMGNHGWTVPDGRDKNSAAAAATPTPATPAPVANGQPASPAAATAAAAQQQDKAFLMRNAECNFVRENAPYSAISAARAKACDLECEQRLKHAPDAPRPAACPTVFKPALGQGVYREQEQQ